MHTDEEYTPGSDAGAPNLGADAGNIAEDDGIRALCGEGRDQLAAHETAACAGEALRERYEQEEDGGS